MHIQQPLIDKWLTLLNTLDNPMIQKPYSDLKDLENYIAFINGLPPSDRGFDFGVCAHIIALINTGMVDLGLRKEVTEISHEVNNRAWSHIKFLQFAYRRTFLITLEVQDINEILIDGAKKIYVDNNLSLDVDYEGYKRLGIKMVELAETKLFVPDGRYQPL
jgi:hypothetical protein|tara:strand:- start:140 stop:625 length:486 start_codon:yes stop_codon:yes gene_type:complete